jgi:hypothetical protein
VEGGAPAPKTLESPAPKTTPYREGKPLADIIPPDRRRVKMLALVGSSMVAGAMLWVLGGWALDALRLPTAPAVVVGQTPGYVAGRLPRATLRGPAGNITLPLDQRAIVHVWLQGCSDCMPAFNAMAQMYSDGALELGAPIVNVAYGEADPTWADRYGVGTNLVFDPGGAKVVTPLGIGTFTTLVVDPDGTVLLRDRPDRPGYAARVRRALASPKSPPLPVTPPPPSTDAPPGPTELDAQAVQRVISSHQAGLRRTCWERADRTDQPTTANVTVAVNVGTNGRVTNATATGDDPLVAKCIERQVRTWTFPAPPNETTLNIPFKFVRQ